MSKVGTQATAGAPASPQHAPSDYRGRIKPIWCPGCGNYAVLKALMGALSQLDIDPHHLSLISGIGCSSRMPGFVKCYGYHSVHGRALPSAIGVKAGNPRLTVIAVGGDGDGLSIGMGHFPHAARRNMDITYIMIDNRIYGLTKGQTSPTTLAGARTKTSPQGVIEVPLNPVELAIIFGSSLVARGFSGNPKELADLLAQGIAHPGFSLIHLLSPCVTFAKDSGFDYFRSRVTPLPEDHDPEDRWAALHATADPDKLYTGVFYRTEREEYLEQIQKSGAGRGREIDDAAPEIDVAALIDRFS